MENKINRVTSNVEGNVLTLTKIVNGKTATATITDTNGNGIFDENAKYEGNSASLFTVAEIQKNAKAAKGEAKATTDEPAKKAGKSATTYPSSGGAFNAQSLIQKWQSIMTPFSTMCFETGDDMGFQAQMPMFFNAIFSDANKMMAQSSDGMDQYNYSDNLSPAREALKAGKDPLVKTTADGDEDPVAPAKHKKGKPVVTRNEDGSKRIDYPDGRAIIKFKNGSKNELHTDRDGNRISVRYYSDGTLSDVTCYRPNGKATTIKARNGVGSLELIKEASKSPAAKAADKAYKARQTAEAMRAKKAEAGSICKDLFGSMKGWGTDSTKLRSAVNKVNKNNVLEVLTQWDKNYADSMSGQGLVQSIGNDIYGAQEYTNKLKTALVLKAKSVGLQEEADAFDAKVTAENDSWYTSDSSIERLFSDLTAKVKDAETRKK